ncbi:Inosine/uridine-preferring nucleoside hydrolase [Ascodesmis nigricans]|uniref:Inosine/uridine-preferring nucleoside hydrolase n=1 Tax=Ascodesmis nigricans TaxID=341454 RepID=A0A4S2N3D3_9PEZI|nr:Inosine/uridine-preferring nucleoside hydrolase [Ascodesmis nigricans]
MTITTTPIWLDCDPGHDDAFAIILAAQHPSFKLLGLSTVHGNASLENVTYNAHAILTAIGRTDVPVYAGCAKPFMRPAVHAPDIHGHSGIDGTDLIPDVTLPKSPHSNNAIVKMRDALMATAPQTAALVATGTLTNVALLFATFPEVAEHIKVLSIMGGAFGDRPDSAGNVTKTAEFNIYCDPESAQSVFSNPVLNHKVRLIPLDTSHTVLATAEVRERLLTGGTKLRKMLHDLLIFFAATYERVFGITAGPPLHDPIAVAAALPTEEIQWKWEEVAIRVDCAGDHVGRTVKLRDDGERVRESSLGGEGKEQACLTKVPKSVNAEDFWKVMLRAVDVSDGKYEWK